MRRVFMRSRTMSKIAIVGGTGLTTLPGITDHISQTVDTPYGAPSGELTIGRFATKEIIFLARHGDPHCIPPHQVNYRANIHALKMQGVDHIIAVNAAGGITSKLCPGTIAVPEQIIDYTYGRAHTFYDGEHNDLAHIDFTYPYSHAIRAALLNAGIDLKIELHADGVYASTQGPRLETAAEIRRLEKDGCDIVGMTGMPEAALAREAGINYACLALVVNWAAGKTKEKISATTIAKHIDQGMGKVNALLRHTIATLCD